MTRAPLVSVVIPAKDEARWIEDCLESLAGQDFPLSMIEIFVIVDASSDDDTDALAKSFLDDHQFARSEVVLSPGGGTPGNLNAGLAMARGEVLCRVDARSRIPSNYVRTCVDLLLSHPDVVVTGGAQIAIPSRDDRVGAGIARALNNRFAMGWSRYRRAATSGSADTVYLGAFRTQELRRAGGWSAEFPTNQDFELNRRLAAYGDIWFDASIPVEYIPRPSIRSLHRQYVRFGRWKVRYWRRTGDRPRPRQLVLAIGPPLLTAGAVIAVARLPVRARWCTVGVGVGLACLAELAGSDRHEADPAVHLCAGAAIAAVGTGWLRGLWSELLLRRGDPR
jgi:glycosyltransferase involved in cell wall biosynthesis